jgi:hypothetical protein
MKAKQLDNGKGRITRRKLLQVFGFGAISTVITAACRHDFIGKEIEDVMSPNSPQIKYPKAF